MNPYHKLQEVSKVFLNPRLDLIKNGEFLEDHCYFILHKYPKITDPIWEIIDTIIHQKKIVNLKIDQIDQISDNNLKHNLKLAKDTNDLDYLSYLLSFRPIKKVKKSLTFHKKHDIISKELSKKLSPKDDSILIDRVQLKLLIHKYIQEHHLQVNNEFMLDETLREILNFNDPIEKLHYFDFLKIYKEKYHSKTELKL